MSSFLEDCHSFSFFKASLFFDFSKKICLLTVIFHCHPKTWVGSSLYWVEGGLKEILCPNFPNFGTQHEQTVCYIYAKFGADPKPSFKVILFV